MFHDPCDDLAILPWSNGKLEALNKTVKGEVIQSAKPWNKKEALQQMTRWVKTYDEEMLDGFIDCVIPKDKLEGRALKILRLRDERLELARARRRLMRSGMMAVERSTVSSFATLGVKTTSLHSSLEKSLIKRLGSLDFWGGLLSL